MNFTSTPQLSSDDKLSILFATQLKVPKAKISRIHHCHRHTVLRIAQRYKEDPNNFLERKKYDTSHRFKLCEEDKIRIIEYVSTRNDATLRQIINELSLPVSRPTIWRFLKSKNIKLCPPTKRKPPPEKPTTEPDPKETT